MNSIELEKQINSPEAQSFEGTTAIFIPIDKEWGVKLFEYEREREHSYDNHVRMYDLDLAPLYGPKVSLNYKNSLYFGYLCELVECCDTAVFEHYGEKHGGVCNGGDYFNYCSYENYSDFLNNDSKWRDAEMSLRMRAEKAGVIYNDNHAGNWGIRKNGESVYIDFDKALRFQ